MNRLFIDIDEILDKNEVDDIIDVHGVVDMRESKTEIKEVFGADKRMMEGINLSDSTGHIKLTLWEDHIDYVQKQIEQGCSSFAFHGIRIKKFRKKVYLTSIPSTIITTVDSIIPCQKEFNNNQADEKKQETILVNEFNLVSGVSKYFMCGDCDKKLTDLQTEQKFHVVKHVVLSRKSRTASKKSPFMLRYQTTRVKSSPCLLRPLQSSWT